nr:hypothetical protein [Morchella crassipes]
MGRPPRSKSCCPPLPPLRAGWGGGRPPRSKSVPPLAEQGGPLDASTPPTVGGGGRCWLAGGGGKGGGGGGKVGGGLYYWRYKRYSVIYVIWLMVNFVHLKIKDLMI